MKITEVINSINVNPWVVFALGVIAVVSLIFAIYSHFSNKNKKEMAYVYTSAALLQRFIKLYDGINVTLDGRTADDIIVTKMAIWNCGNQSIKQLDFAKNNMLKIIAKNGAEILDVKIIAENETCNNFKIDKRTEKEVIVDFDYIDPKNGVVLQILHTGKPYDIEARCKLIGGKEINNFNRRIEKKSKKRSNKIKYDENHKIFLVICLIYLFALVIVKVIFSSDVAQLITQNKIMFGLNIINILWWIDVFAFSFYSNNNVVPKGLRCFSNHELWSFMDSFDDE